MHWGPSMISSTLCPCTTEPDTAKDLISNTGHYQGIDQDCWTGYINRRCPSRQRIVPIFKLADLVKMYQSHAIGNMPEWSCEPYHLKSRILAHFPDLQTHKEGRGVLLVCDEDVGLAMRIACDLYDDTKGIHFACVANIIHSDPQQENIVHLYVLHPVPKIISAKFIGAIVFNYLVRFQHQSSVKLLVETSGSTDDVTF